MAELSKQALKVENNTEFPNNNNGQITPVRLRTFNEDMIDSTVNQTRYDIDSGSWNQQINALEAFSSSVGPQATGSLLLTASFDNGTRNLTFTKGDASTFAVNIPDASGSAGDFVTTSSFNAFTQSIDGRVDALEAATSSYAISSSVAAVDAAQQIQINSLTAATASYAISSSVAAVDAGQQAQINALIAFTSSAITNTGSFATTGSNTFYGTQNISGSILPVVNGQGDLGNDSLKWNSIVVNGQIKGTSLNTTGRAFVGTVRLSDESFPLGFLDAREIVADGQGVDTHLYYGTGSATDALRELVYVQSGSNADFSAVSASFNSRINNITGSGGTINTGSFATTGSNSFVGNQIISGGLVVSGSQPISFSGSSFLVNTSDGGGPIIFKPGTSIQFLGNTDFTNPGRFPLLNVDASGSGYYGFNNEIVGRIYQDFSGSVDARINAISPVATGSLLITASAAGADITFTKGDGSTFSVTVATGSVASASFAETASLAINAKDIVVDVKNTTGAQINKGTVVRIIGATGDNPLIQTASWENDASSANTLGFVVTDIPNDAFGRVMTQGTLLSVNTDPALGYTAGQLVYLSSSGQFTNVAPPAPYHEVRLGQVLRAQQNNGSIYVLVQNGYELSELHDVNINTGSLATNDLLAYNSASGQWENESFTALGLATTGSNTFRASQTITSDGNTDVTIQSTAVSGQTNLVLDAFQNNVTAKGNLSFTNNGQFGGSGSVKFISTLNNIEFASDSGTKIGPTNGGGNGINTQAISLQSHSGSLSLAPSGFNNTTASLSHISSSSGTNFVNLMFKNNSNTAETIISGSNNIYVNPGAPTAGFKRYFGGSGNIALNSINVPLISGSMAFSPTMNNNYFGGNSTTLVMRGPVSSSAYTISANSILGAVNIGSSAANNAEKLISGLTLTGNQIAGTLTVIASKTNLSQSLSFTNNNLNGGLTINANSSSVSMTNNNINDATFTINNNFFSSSAGLSAMVASRNNIGGQATTLTAQGTASAASSQPVISDNAIFGGNNTIFIDTSNSLVSGSITYSHALRNIVAGNNLIITGSGVLADFSSLGSAYFGRYNAQDGTKSKTNETVFAVGTGNTTTRKTGFLIDSGSNTFVEGSLNVSGSTSFTGSMNVLSGSASGSVVTNVGDTFTSTDAVTKIISLSSAEYAGITPDPNTLYIIV